MNISKSTIDIICSNIWDANGTQQYLCDAPADRRLTVLSQFLKDATALRGWAEDFDKDSHLSEDDLPEFAKEYRKASKEMYALANAIAPDPDLDVELPF
jgi:hypothetical protein